MESGVIYEFFFFFFKQKTAYEILTCDWSSDVCSSDLDVADSYGGAKDCATHDYFSYLKHLEHKSKRRSQINCQKHIL